MSGIHIVPKGISLKVNVIAQLEFELIIMLQSNTLASMPWRFPSPILCGQ